MLLFSNLCPVSSLDPLMPARSSSDAECSVQHPPRYEVMSSPLQPLHMIHMAQHGSSSNLNTQALDLSYVTDHISQTVRITRQQL